MIDSSRILFEDNHIIAINKRVGELVQGDNTGDDPVSEPIKKYLKKKYNKPGNVFLGVTHRIDRPVSGVVVFARTSKALSRLNEMFRKGAPEKSYFAIVKNKPEKNSGTLTHWMTKDQKKNKSFCYDRETPDTKRAELEYEIVGKSDKYFLIKVKLITGRHHQIRAQLSKIGSPIKGDLKYGFDRSNPDGGIDLHAYTIKFEHPVKKEMIEIVSPLPEGKLWDYFSKLI